MRKSPVITTRCLAAASLLIVFIIDMITPNEIVVDILYLCCILIVFKENSRTIIIFSMIACLLIVVDALFNLKFKFNMYFCINRGMSVFAILIASYIAIRYRKLNQAGILKQLRHLDTLEEILFITSHQVRKPVANILGLIEIINNDRVVLSANDLKNCCNYLYSSATELDVIIKELNTFIEHTEIESQTDNISQPVLSVLTEAHHHIYSALQTVAQAPLAYIGLIIFSARTCT